MSAPDTLVTFTIQQRTPNGTSWMLFGTHSGLMSESVARSVTAKARETYPTRDFRIMRVTTTREVVE